MFSKEDQKAHNQQFWKGFEKRMKAHKSANGKSMSWLQYKTDLKDSYLRLHADQKSAALRWDFQHNEEIRSIVWEQLEELRALITASMPSPALWLESVHLADGRNLARLEWQLEGVNYYREEDRNEIYGFLEGHLLAFDEFYQEFKEILINLMA